MLSIYALLFNLMVAPVQAEEIPALTRPVEDYAAVFTAAETTELENKIREIRSQGIAQIQVLTLQSLNGDSIEGVSNRYAEAWKLGKKGVQDGILITVAPSERKVRIEVAQGLQGDITDLVSGRIIRNVIVPAFRSRSYFDGVMGAILAIRAKLAHETSAAADSELPQIAKSPYRVFLFIGFMFLFGLFGVAVRFYLFMQLVGQLGWAGAMAQSRSRRSNWSSSNNGFGGFGGGGFGGGGGGWGGGGGGGFSGGGSSGSW